MYTSFITSSQVTALALASFIKPALYNKSVVLEYCCCPTIDSEVTHFLVVFINYIMKHLVNGNFLLTLIQRIILSTNFGVNIFCELDVFHPTEQ